MVIHKQSFLYALIALLIFGGGIWIGSTFLEKTSNEASNVILTDSLLNPVLEAGLEKHFIINFQPLRATFESVLKKYNQKVYIYFSYLNNAAWIGINERDAFFAASTTKVPLAMGIYKAIEQGKLRATDEYSLEALDLNRGFGELYKKGEGTTFTVEELIRIMLVESDNTAAIALAKIMERIGIQNPFVDVYIAMGWDFLGDEQKLDFTKINTKVLSNMFLSLYNATYINPTHSNQILEYLTHTRFDEKIRQGVPSAIPIAHKMGIAGNNEIFTDCGIVYAPQRHYILCISSNGGDEKGANNVMAEISKITYEYVMSH